ncbi:hypothetical protein [Pedobacter sp.]|uniref:hypothetical protein n=1 Tax=Pedobacter sp. TaxID=1411316 RepID=UPI003D7F3CDA
MKHTNFKIITALMAIALFASACKKNAPDQWLQDNITIIGKVPVIASFTVKAPNTISVTAGSPLQLDLRYWSDEPMDKINLRSAVGTGAQQLVSTTAYQKAYSTVSRTDSLLIPYTVPAGLATGSKISVEVEVVNKNTLTKKLALTLTVK